MKTGITILWASAALALAFANVPTTAGQEKGKAVIKTGRTASVPVQNVQLRADEEEELPDSIIVYSPTDEKMMKQIYLPGESYGQSTWENGAWIFLSEYLSTSYLGIYNRENLNKQLVTVSYKINEDILYYYYPFTGFNHAAYYFPASTDFKPEFDTNGNLISFKADYNTDVNAWIYEFIATYNAGNKPVSIEGWASYDGRNRQQFFKAHYAYNAYGYCTLLDSYEWDYAGDVWKSQYKETAGYDAQGKILYRNYDMYGKIKSKDSYEYYDETHFSLVSTYADYDEDGIFTDSREEWKYGADGRPEAYYYYKNDELSQYAVFYYPDPSGNIPVSAGSNVWSSGGQLYIAATTNGAAQVYAVSGQLLKTVALTAGQTAATPLPRGLYIVATGGKTWKVIL
jgi:hypothetical protein